MKGMCIYFDGYVELPSMGLCHYVTVVMKTPVYTSDTTLVSSI